MIPRLLYALLGLALGLAVALPLKAKLDELRAPQQTAPPPKVMA